MPEFLPQVGAVALVEATDWTATPLGPAASWPTELRTLADVMLGSNQPMFVVWGPARTLVYNQGYAAILAGKHPAAMGRDFLAVWHEIRADLEPIVARAYRGEPVQMDDITLVMERHGFPEETHFSFFYSPVRDGAGAVSGFFCACTDITSQVMAERRLRASEARLRSVLEGMHEGFALLDRDFRIIDVNPETLRLDGRPPDALLGQTHWEVYPGSEQSELGRLYRQAMTERMPVAYEHWFSWPDGGDHRCLDMRAYPVADGLAVFFRDVTDRKRAEAAGQAEAERVELALDAGAIVGTWVWEVTEDRFTADERFARSFGLDAARCQAGVALQEVVASIHPDDTTHVQRAIADALRTGGAYRCAYRVRHAGGGFRWVEASGRVELGSDGRPRRFPGVLIDIEERRRAEEERDRAAGLLRAFADAVPGVVYAKDRQGRMIVANAGTAALIGKPPAEFLGRTDREFLEDQREAEAIMRTDQRIMESGVAEQIEEEVRLPDGAPAVWLSTKAPMRNAAGAVVGLIGSSVDITARKQAEAVLARGKAELEQLVHERTAALQEAQARLAHAQRMEALGQLAGGIAHDFNNVLQAVQGGAALIERQASDAARVRQLARMVTEATSRGSAVTRRLLAFSRRGDLRAEAVAPRALLAGLREMLSHTLGAGITVKVDAADTLPDILADKGQLETVLINLATNARDAMDGSGVIGLAASAATMPGAAPTDGSVVLPAGRYVVVSVSDTGTGMAPEVLARASEPFFTTKQAGKGTGLGLAMARGFAEQSGGTLRITSAAGRGTTVALWLPVAFADPDADADAGLDRPARSSAARRILLVDDDQIVRTVTAEELRESGMTVLTADGGAAALDRLAAGEAVDLLVTDLSMPGMDGIALIRAARRLRPRLPAIMMTGFATGDAELAFADPADGAFALLRKPVPALDLLGRIEAMLHAGGDGFATAGAASAAG